MWSTMYINTRNQGFVDIMRENIFYSVTTRLFTYEVFQINLNVKIKHLRLGIIYLFDRLS